MTFDEFKDALEALASLKKNELIEAGVFAPHDLESWSRFRADPLGWFLRADREAARGVWLATEYHAHCGPSHANPMAAHEINVIQLPTKAMR